VYVKLVSAVVPVADPAVAPVTTLDQVAQSTVEADAIVGTAISAAIIVAPVAHFFIEKTPLVFNGQPNILNESPSDHPWKKIPSARFGKNKHQARR
jgi:hypothetical protein